ncbi:hypothetical protein MMC25_001884 [Agyrium rufum]|nr:hypothetical protein [Agyrium rufum]
MADPNSSDESPLPSWVVDLKTKPTAKPKNTSLPDPPGFTSNKRISKTNASTTALARKPPTPAEMDTLKLKKSWEVALAPAKALPMNAVMMYMSGNSLQIFSIMMVFMLFKNPVQGLLSTGQVFQRYETEGTRGQMWMVKIVYIAMNLVALALGVWKVNGMGLFPTTRSDWLAWETERVPLEKAVFAL